MRRLFVTYICLLLAVQGWGQSSRKADKLYRRALTSYATWHKATAYSQLERAIRKSPQNPDLYAQLGKWYFSQHYYRDAARIYLQGAQQCRNGGRRFALPLARSMVYNSRPDTALRIISSHTGGDTATWNKLLRQAVFVQKALMMPAIQPMRMSARVNTRYPEQFPCIGPDTARLYFTRRTKNMDDDLYCSSYDTCGDWYNTCNNDITLANLNTGEQESGQFVSADGHYLFFSRGENRSDNGWEMGSYDLYIAYRINTDSAWTTPEPFRATINTPDAEIMPCLSPDNHELYFVSDRPGGYGGKDIWISTYENYLWQLPRNAGPAINTAGDETAPHICADNKTLLFTSDGHIGMGGKDIYKALRIKDTVFSGITNLGYPINTAYNEESEWMVNSDKLIFASDRQGPAGNYDLYETLLPLSLRPGKTIQVSGYTYDSISREHLNAAHIYITNALRGDTIYHMLTNRGDGTYSIPLKAGIKYIFHSARIQYADRDDTFTLKPDSAINGRRVRNICLLRNDYKEPIHDSLIATVHFDINRVELPEEDKQHVYKAIEPFLLDKDIRLFVNAYTDNTGNPMLNEELSVKRAEQVAAVLANFGIDEDMIVAKGWGEANTIASNDTEEGQRKNRRVEVILKRE